MIKQTEAYFYTESNQEVLTQNHLLTRSLDFNRHPFKPILKYIAEHTLANAATHTLAIKNTTMLLPLVGAFMLENELYGPGDLLCFGASTSAIIVENPYPDNAISFLELQINNWQQKNPHFTTSFDLENQRNKLNLVAEIYPDCQVYLGLFDSRNTFEMNFTGSKPVFCKSLLGTFEVMDRLLSPKDALLLNDISNIEVETLDQQNILLIVT